VKGLVKADLLQRTSRPDGGVGYEEGSRGLVRWLLLSAAAELEHASSGAVMPVPSSGQAVRALAEPTDDAEATRAVAIQMPRLPSVRPEVSIRQIVDLRATEKLERRRNDYVQEQRRLWEEITRRLHGLPHAEQLAAMKFWEIQQGQCQSAFRSYRDFLGKGGIALAAASGTGAVGTAMTAVLTLNESPGALPLTASALSVVSGVFCTVIPLMVRRDAPRFLRSARTVLQPPIPNFPASG
jgi:hypothetical protein